MAGDWIKMRGNLWDDPRVGRLCDLTGQGEAAVVGGLYWLWAAADQHTEDGCMPGLSLRQIDRKTGIPGFGQALCDVGWLVDDPQGVVIPRFDEHNGASAKRRTLDAQRKANSRAPSASSPAPIRDMSASDADKTRTDGGQNTDEMRRSAELEKEKRREEIPPIPPKGARPPAVGLKAWLADVKARGEKPIPDGDPVFAYAEGIGLPHEFLHLAWLEFRSRYSLPEAKRYRDWRAVFRKAVRGNWMKLWWQDRDDWSLTTAGVQAQRTHQRDAA